MYISTSSRPFSSGSNSTRKDHPSRLSGASTDLFVEALLLTSLVSVKENGPLVVSVEVP